MQKELSSYEIWQLERYGNILPGSRIVVNFVDGEMENGMAEQERFVEWMNENAERQISTLLTKQKQYQDHTIP